MSSTSDTFCRNVILYVHVKILTYLWFAEMLSWGLGCIYSMSENCEALSNQSQAQNTKKSNNPSFLFFCKYTHHLSCGSDHNWKQSRFFC